MDLTYLGQVTPAGGSSPRAPRFAMRLSVSHGPPVTVTRIGQPSAGITMSSTPAPPFRTKAGSVRKIVITMHVTDCGKVPKNAGLPFVDVTLRNTRAMEEHSFIPGSRYAHDLSTALQVACSNETRHHQNA
ncbi:hypothetical protein [Streptomyces mangrovisoli]|uniref:hypothetical protein n=1 Tax=Streptomyces mangrovisoli TaxID=1428628 RepID=UPI003B846D98